MSIVDTTTIVALIREAAGAHRRRRDRSHETDSESPFGPVVNPGDVIILPD